MPILAAYRTMSEPQSKAFETPPSSYDLTSPLFLLTYYMCSHSWPCGIHSCNIPLRASRPTSYIPFYKGTLLHSQQSSSNPLRISSNVTRNPHIWMDSCNILNLIYISHQTLPIFASQQVCCLCRTSQVPHNFYLNCVLYTRLKSLVWQIAKTRITWEWVIDHVCNLD